MNKTSRPKRWAIAAEGLRAAYAALEIACERFADSAEALEEVRAEYEEWRDSLPEGLQQSAVGEKLDALCDIDTGVVVDLSEAETLVDEAESADLPLGFGRD